MPWCIFLWGIKFLCGKNDETYFWNDTHIIKSRVNTFRKVFFFNLLCMDNEKSPALWPYMLKNKWKEKKAHFFFVFLVHSHDLIWKYPPVTKKKKVTHTQNIYTLSLSRPFIWRVATLLWPPDSFQQMNCRYLHAVYGK